MPSLRHSDLQNLQRCIAELYADDDPKAFPSAVNRALTRLRGAESTSYNSIDTRNQRIQQVVHSGPEFSSQQIEAFERHIHEHPLIQYCQKNPAHPAARICDFLTPAQFRRSGLYNEFFRTFGWSHQLAVGVAAGPNHVIGVAMTRGGVEFSQREKLLLDLLRPHIVTAFRNAQALAKLKDELGTAHQMLESIGRGVIALGSDGRIESATRTALQLLAAFYPDPNRSPQCLPCDIADWLVEQLPGAAGNFRIRPPLVCDRPQKRLVIRLVVASSSKPMLLLEEHCIHRQIALLTELGLTRRESEVLAWMSQGKSDPEIAILLRLSERTIQKHLEHIFAKLGVATRTAAVLRALEWST